MNYIMVRVIHDTTYITHTYDASCYMMCDTLLLLC